jgi:hypothetical protein
MQEKTSGAPLHRSGREDDQLDDQETAPDLFFASIARGVLTTSSDLDRTWSNRG